jgi:enterochelin esterase family protein
MVAGDEDSGWSTIEQRGLILDNLIAAGKAKPMVVVMPQWQPARDRRVVPGVPPIRQATAAFQGTDSTSELMKDVIPFVEKKLPCPARQSEPGDRRALDGWWADAAGCLDQS